jgi:membrane protease YdiL (CAAX protease family)
VTEETTPFPGLLSAIWLTVGSWLLTGIVLSGFVDPLGPLPALGIGIAGGVGLTATLAARRVPPPQAERLGMRGFTPRVLLALVFLIPLVLLVSEIDNVVKALMPAADVGPTDLDAGLFALESAIVMVGIAPVVEEFFFRGVLQQGLVAAHGTLAGVFTTALLYALGHGNLVGTEAGWISTTLGSLVTGLVLGYARLASGSLLAAILLSTALSGSGVLSLQMKEELAIPGFNAGGAHTPAPWLLGAMASVGLGLALLAAERRRTPDDEIAAEPPPSAAD